MSIKRYISIYIFFLFFTLVFYSQSLHSATKGRAEVYKVTMNYLELCTDSTCSNPTILCTNSATADIASVTAGADVGNWCSLGGLPIGTTYTHLRVRINRNFTMKGYIVDHDDHGVSGMDCYTGQSTAGSKTKFAPGSEHADATSQTRVEQDIWLVDGRGNSSNYLTSQAGADSAWMNAYTQSDKPTGSTSWCVGSTTNHAAAAGVCADSNTTSTTWDNNATANTMQIIYPLSSAYTVGPVSPKLQIAFNTSEAMQATIINNDCEMRPGSPSVVITLAD